MKKKRNPTVESLESEERERKFLELTYSDQLACEYQREDKSTDRGGRGAHFPPTNPAEAADAGGKESPRSFTPPGLWMSAASPRVSSLGGNHTAPLRPAPCGTSSTGKRNPFPRLVLFLLWDLFWVCCCCFFFVLERSGDANYARTHGGSKLASSSPPARTETWDLLRAECSLAKSLGSPVLG